MAKVLMVFNIIFVILRLGGFVGIKPVIDSYNFELKGMKYLLLILIAVSLLVSCGIDPQRKKKDRTKLIESIAKEQTDSLKIELDSLCKEANKNEFDFLVDSVLEVKLVEIEGRIEEYQK